MGFWRILFAQSYVNPTSFYHFKWFLYTLYIYIYIYIYTVKPVYNDHSRDQVIVVFVDRWSLFRGEVVHATEVAHGVAYSGHYRQVVFLYKWSLRQVSLYIYYPALIIRAKMRAWVLRSESLTNRIS